VPGSPSPVSPGRRNDLTDVSGIRVGHHHQRGRGWLTGTTVVLTPPGTVGGVDVRGGGPSSRETDALAPTTLVEVVHAIVLSGGSSYGLAASTGVTDWLGERHIGFPVGPEPEHVVPIVAAACLFDLGAGGRFDLRPDAAFGRAAAEAAKRGGRAGGAGRRDGRSLAQGTVGAGTGAHAGSIKGGIGSASALLANGATVAALVAVNSRGDVFDPATGDLYGRRHLLAGELADLRRPAAADVRAARAGGGSGLRIASGRAGAGALGVAAGPGVGAAGVEAGPGHERAGANTTLAVVATDALLTKPECTRLAIAGHDGMARAIRPIHAMTDGDIAFALATGACPLPDLAGPGSGGLGASRPSQLSELMAAAADAVSRSIVHAVVAATSTPTMTSYLDRFPSARRR
jgi:putative pantetheine hydrolase